MDKRLLDLLEIKNFGELSCSDKENILKHCSKEDFEAMGHLTAGCRTNFEHELDKMEPKEDIRDNLLAAYQQKYKTRPEKKWNVLLLELKFLVRMPVFRYGVLGAVFLMMSLSIWILFVGNKSNNKDERTTTAMDIGQIKNFEEMNKNLYFNDAGLNERIIMPEVRGNP